MNSLIVIVGATGVGKTELCLSVAEHYGIPIINADSRQIFTEIPIGTAAPTEAQQRRIRHFFVGNHHIKDYYSASMFEQDVLDLLKNLYSKGNNIALMTGGSMMYIDAVCNGIDDIPTVDSYTRAMMMSRLEREGLPALLAELKILDPEHYNIVDKNNTRRVVHALEICHITGKTYTSFRKNTKKIRPFNIIKIGLNRTREELYERINRRVCNMINNGLIDEAKSMYQFKGLNALNTVGYKELFEHFEGNLTLDQAVLNIQSNTRRYCRKQLTWFKKDNQIHWFNPNNNIEEIINYIGRTT